MNILILAAVTYANIAKELGCDVIAEDQNEVKNFYKVEKKASKLLAQLLKSDVDKYYSNDLDIEKDFIKDVSLTDLQYNIYENSGFIDEWLGYDLSGPTEYWLSDNNPEVPEDVRKKAKEIARDALDACGFKQVSFERLRTQLGELLSEGGFFGSYTFGTRQIYVVGREVDGKRLTWSEGGQGSAESVVRNLMKTISKWGERPFLFETEEDAKAALEKDIRKSKNFADKPVSNEQVCYITL